MAWRRTVGLLSPYCRGALMPKKRTSRPPQQRREARMDNTVGENIRKYREARSWTQVQLAEAAVIDERTVQRAESGRAIGAESLQAIAGALDVSIERLRESPDEEELR